MPRLKTGVNCDPGIKTKSFSTPTPKPSHFLSHTEIKPVSIGPHTETKSISIPTQIQVIAGPHKKQVNFDYPEKSTAVRV